MLKKRNLVNVPLYHGTTKKNACSIRDHGFDSSLSGKATGAPPSLGRGFYLTTLPAYACFYGSHVAKLFLKDDAKILDCWEGKEMCYNTKEYKDWKRRNKSIIDDIHSPTEEWLPSMAKENGYNGIYFSDRGIVLFDNNVIKSCEVKKCPKEWRDRKR